MEEKYFNAFNLIGVGPISFQKLLEKFSSLEEAWQSNLEGILNRQVIAKRTRINPEKEYEKLAKRGIKVLTIKDKTYPKLLKEIYAPPALLYIQGKLSEPCLGIVGSRELSPYGFKTAPKLSFELARKGLTIVSGLAKGIDTLAHQSALKARGKTIAVLGSGLDIIYPKDNQKLSKEIIQTGAVISEFPLGTPPKRQNFPQRNRIVSGLSRGVLIIEAGERSGSLITARQALEQNRDVFAVPGPINSLTSAGTNGLIKLGAKPVTEVNDILEELSTLTN
jgi:DNA processing protein